MKLHTGKIEEWYLGMMVCQAHQVCCPVFVCSQGVSPVVQVPAWMGLQLEDRKL